MRYYCIVIQVDFENPRSMPATTLDGKTWHAIGYFQTFYCTADSRQKAKQLVYQHFLQDEESPSACQIKYDRVAWMRTLSSREDLTHGYDTGLTEERFANRDKVGIWHCEDKQYYVSEIDAVTSMLENEITDHDDDDEYWEGYEGQCQACDDYGPVDDMSLCNECSGKLERDFIRQRNWDYSASAFGLPVELREKLRDDVINNYGKDLELIASSNNEKKPKRTNRGQRK